MKRHFDSPRQRMDIAKALSASARQAAHRAGEGLVEAHERARSVHTEAAELYKRRARELAARGRLREARAVARSSLKEKRWAREEAGAADSARERLTGSG